MYGGNLRPQPGRLTAEPMWGDAPRLLAIEQIRQTKAWYCFYLDTKDWAGYETLFTADAVLEVPGHSEGHPAQRVEGAAGIRRFVEQAVRGVTTTHHCHTPIIEFESTVTATVAWAMEDMLHFPAGAPMKTLHGTGHYFERYRQEGGHWRIARCRLTRLRLDVT